MYFYEINEVKATWGDFRITDQEEALFLSVYEWIIWID